MPETETAEEISKKPEVRKELERAGEKEPAKKVKAATTDKFWFVTHGLLLLGCAVLYYLVGTKLLPLIQSEVDLGRRFLRGFALVVIVLATAKAVRVYAIGRIEDTVTRFTLRRILLLVAGLLIAVIVISVVFVNWYGRSEEHTSELQSHSDLVCRLLLEKKKYTVNHTPRKKANPLHNPIPGCSAWPSQTPLRRKTSTAKAAHAYTDTGLPAVRLPPSPA